METPLDIDFRGSAEKEGVDKHSQADDYQNDGKYPNQSIMTETVRNFGADPGEKGCERGADSDDQ